MIGSWIPDLGLQALSQYKETIRIIYRIIKLLSERMGPEFTKTLEI